MSINFERMIKIGDSVQNRLNIAGSATKNQGVCSYIQHSTHHLANQIRISIAHLELLADIALLLLQFGQSTGIGIDFYGNQMKRNEIV